jgi:T4 bacteriophage base plate protein
MRPLSASELLRVWEQGHGKPSYRKAMLILAAACSEESTEELAELSIGSRDSRLLTLRELTFGPELTSLTVCPACSEKLESSLNVADLRISTPEPRNQLLHLELDDYSIDFRLPNTGDLIEAGRSSDLEQIQRELAKRCVNEIRRQDEKLTTEHLPSHVVELLAMKMTEADPQADTQLSLSCPVCGHSWQALFDIVSYFWSEIQAWAVRILREVHLLASAYGWREADILAMSPLRRHLYLGMVGP